MRQAARPSEPTSQRILDAARSLMTERELVDVPLADISERAGTNIALVSYYFGNREGLMLAIAEADAELALANLDRLLASDLKPTEKIASHIRGLIEVYFKRPYLHRLLEKLLRDGSPKASERVGLALVKPVADARAVVIAEGIRLGEFREVDAGLMSVAIDGACSHLFSSVARRRAILGDGALNADLIDSYAREIVGLFARGMTAKATDEGSAIR